MFLIECMIGMSLCQMLTLLRLINLRMVSSTLSALVSLGFIFYS